MRLIPAVDSDAFAESAAAFVVDRAAKSPPLNLAIPTGRTPLGLYRRLRAEAKAGRFTLGNASVFMLDEYVDLPRYPKGSFVEFLREQLGSLVFNPHTVFNPLTPGDASRPLDYDTRLDAAGGLDLAILGVGRNGHIGFNEPGSLDAQRTHVVRLAADTLTANFADVVESQRPSLAITVGLADLLAARSVLVLIAGANKASVAAAMQSGIRVEDLPVTHLLGHPDLTVVVEEALLRRI